MHTALTVLSALPFYLLGAFPSGVLISKLYGVRIERAGSGNVGATNVTRVIGMPAGLLTLALDAGKGYFAVGLAYVMTSTLTYAVLAGVAAVAGHCFSIPPKLKGGKGVATGFGVCLYLCRDPAIIGAVLFAIVAWKWRFASLASVSAALSIPLFALLLNLPDPTVLGAAAVALLVVFRHRDNLSRLAMGTEPKFVRKL